MQPPLAKEPNLTAGNVGIFDLSSAEGVNESERFLIRLCRKSFLSLWAHANLHTAQDMREGKGSAKEFSDVLVVFGDDVIIFSDKHVEFQQSRDIAIAWPRWFKRAVVESAKQLHGAMNWLRRFPNRIFLDAACTRSLPIPLPSANSARYHLVAITRGSREACTKAFPGSSGTLSINTGLEGSEHNEVPFTVGIVNRSAHFVHVFDEFSLEVVMDEMDTITDFVAYLNAREAFLGSVGTTVVAAGEEQLIAAYILNGDDSNHPFLPIPMDGQTPDLVVLDDSHYPSLVRHPAYLEKRHQDKRSRAWDDLIERLIHMGDPKLVFPNVDQPNRDTEKALRLMAAESRFRRGLLTDSLLEMLLAAADQPKQRRARVFTTREQPDLVYIFLVTPRLIDETDDEYRKHRVAMLHAYCRCAKLRFSQADTFIAIGLDHPARDYEMSSEDLIVFTCHEYSPEEKAEAENYQRKFRILADGFTMKEEYATEFSPKALPKAHPKPKRQNDRKRDRKSKIAKVSRRRNRR